MSRHDAARRGRALFLFKAAVSIALLAVLFAQTDATSLYAAVRRASVPWLIAALALYFVMIVASAWRWNLLLAAQRVSVSGLTLVRSFLVATFFNSFLPSNIGGDVIRIRDTSRPAGSLGRATTIVVVDRAMGLVALLLVAAIGGSFAVVGRAGPALPVRLPWLWSAFVAAAGGFATLVVAPQKIMRLVSAVPLLSRDSILRRVRTLVDMMLAFRAQPGVLATSFIGAILAQAILVAFYLTIAYSLNIPISALHLAVVVPMSFVVQLLPVSVNGFGVREATFTYYFTALNLPIESALVLSIVGAGLVLLISLAGGVLYVARQWPGSNSTALDSPLREPSD